MDNDNRDNRHDHRALGNRLDLFHQQEDAPGMVFWHPRGAVLYRVLENYIYQQMRRAGFHEVRTPQLLARSLWERSGHLEKFGQNMFMVDDGERVLALKPMSCPGHIQIFNKRVRSYRDLPLRLCELGACHRNELSGALSGLMRTRAFEQDDAHIFCRSDQIDEEVHRFCVLLKAVYLDFGFSDYAVKLSTRPLVRAGSDAVWDRAEAALESAAKASGLDYSVQPGEGAFYGPKLEFLLRDSHGREWQCGTLQLDFVLPERLDAEYVDHESHRVRPVMIHHAILGSLERFAAILLEHHRGDLPLWLAPEQVVVASVSDSQIEYARKVAAVFGRDGLRTVLDDRAETLSRRVVYAFESGIPVFAAVGARDEQDGTVAIRRRAGKPVTMAIAEAARELRLEAKL
jgi:threonyl-tRNA synthetase